MKEDEDRREKDNIRKDAGSSKRLEMNSRSPVSGTLEGSTPPPLIVMDKDVPPRHILPSDRPTLHNVDAHVDRSRGQHSQCTTGPNKKTEVTPSGDTTRMMITVNGVRLDDILKKKRQESLSRTPPTKRKMPKTTKKQKTTTPSVESGKKIWEYMVKKRARTDSLEDNTRCEDDPSTANIRSEDNPSEERRQPSNNINVMKNVNDGDLNLDDVKLTFKTAIKTTPKNSMNVRKSSINEKILKFQELSQGHDCVIGSGRCATHNVKMVRVVKNVRKSESTDGGGVRWRLCESTLLECPRTGQGKLSNDKLVMSSQLPEGGPIRTEKTFSFTTEDQPDRSTR